MKFEKHCSVGLGGGRLGWLRWGHLATPGRAGGEDTRSNGTTMTSGWCPEMIQRRAGLGGNEKKERKNGCPRPLCRHDQNPVRMKKLITLVLQALTHKKIPVFQSKTQQEPSIHESKVANIIQTLDSN